MRPIQVGDVVCYSTLFLKATFASPTDPRWHARGTVESIDANEIATVRWTRGYGDPPPARVAASSLARFGSLAASEPIDPRTGLAVRF